MFTEDNIEDLVQLLAMRGVHLYHACQVLDFSSYLQIGGVPSRAHMARQGLPFTGFTTDAVDKANAVWDKVFCNLEDFGKAFAEGRNVAPTAYGPILFRFKPFALREASDVAICLRSAGAQGFDRHRESLKTIEQVDDVFYYSRDYPYGRAYLKYMPNLQAQFGPHARSVEISCTIASGFLSFEHLLDVVVDPYIIKGNRLPGYVDKIAADAGFNFAVNSRNPKKEPERYDQLLLAVGENPPTPLEFSKRACTPNMRKWAIGISNGSKTAQLNYERFCKYLYEGTVTPMAALRTVPLPTVIYAEDFPDGEYPFHLDPEFSGQDHQEYLVDRVDDQEEWARAEEDGWPYSDADGSKWN
jgi:hypothetical protein